MPNSNWTESGTAISLVPVTTPVVSGAQESPDYLTNSDKINLMAQYAAELATKTQLDTTAASLSVSSTYYDNAVAAISTGLIAAGAPSNWATTWPDGTTSGPWTGIQTSLGNWWEQVAAQRTALQASISAAQAAAAQAAATAAAAQNTTNQVNGAIADAQQYASNAQAAAIAAASTDASNKMNTAITTAQNLAPLVVTGLPALPSSSYPSGRLAWNTTDGQLYRSTGSTWTALTVSAPDISGTLSASQIASLAASQVTGTLSASQIASVTAAQVTGQITGTQIANGAVSTPQLAAGAVTANNIAANTITASQIAASTITGTQVAAGTITGNNIAAGTIQAGNIAAGTITGDRVAANTITGSNVAAGAITANNIASSTITAGQIAAGAITTSKLVVTSQGLALNSDPYCKDATAWTMGDSGNGFSVVNVSDGLIGSSALQMTSADVRSLPIPLSPNKTYRIKVTARGVGAAAPNCYIRLYQYGASASIPASGYPTSGIINNTTLGTGQYENFTIPGSWTTYTITVTTYSGVAQGLLSFHGAWTLSSPAVQVQDFEIAEMTDSSLIVDGTVTTTKLAAGSVTASAIAANAVTSSAIASNAITTNKLAVTSTGLALNSDPFCMDSTAWAIGDGGSFSVVNVSDGFVGTSALQLCAGGANVRSTPIPITPGKTYRLKVTCRSVGGSLGGWIIRFYQYAASAACPASGYPNGSITATLGYEFFTVGTGWTTYTITVTAASGAAYGLLSLHAGWAQGSNYVGQAQDFELAEMSDASLIVDGTITSAKIATGTITADMITTGTLNASSVNITNLNASNITTGTMSASKVLFPDGSALTTANRVQTAMRYQQNTTTTSGVQVPGAAMGNLSFSVTSSGSSDTFNIFGSLSGGQTAGTVGTTCNVVLCIDGSNTAAAECSVSYATLNGVQSNSFIMSITGLSAGTHTFTFYLQSSLSSATFQSYNGTTLLIQRIF